MEKKVEQGVRISFISESKMTGNTVQDKKCIT